MDPFTILIPKHEKLGISSSRRMCKYFYSNGESSFRAISAHWSVIERTVSNISDIYEILQEITPRDDVAVVREKFCGSDPSYTRRNKNTFRDEPIHWVCFDVDDEEVPDGVDPTSLEALEALVKRFPPEFHDVSYVAHFSSSAGLKGNKLKVHLWFWLDKPIKREALKRWARSLLIKVDSALFNRVQLHLVCDPIFEDTAMDPFDGVGKKRLNFVNKSRDSVPLSFSENTPTPSKSNKEGVGVFSGQKKDYRPESFDEDGKLIDERERWHCSIRWYLLHQGYTDFEKFKDDVFSIFQEQCALGPTPLSETDWNRELSDAKCEQDRDRLADYSGPGELTQKQYCSREDAQEKLRAATELFLFSEESNAIKAAAGLGKTTVVCEAVSSTPNIKDMNVEVFVPTKDLGHEISDKLSSHLNVQVYEGRSEDNCNQFEYVKAIAELGGGVEHRICGRPTSENQCQYRNTCGFYKQSQDSGPKIRIMSHSYLGLPRPDFWPKPDLIIVDESIAAHMVEKEVINGSLCSVAAGLTFSVTRELKADPTPKHPSEIIEQSDLRDVMAFAGTIDDAMQADQPILERLRSQDITPADLKRAAQVTRALTPRASLTPGMSEDQTKSAIRSARAKTEKRARILAKIFQLLSTELGFSRANPKSIKVTNGGMELAYKRDLPRLHDCPVLFIDADLEPDLLAVFLPDLKHQAIDVRYNATVTQISDRSFSKSSLGLLGDKTPTDLQRSLIEFLGNHPEPKKTLIISYKSLNDIFKAQPGLSDCGFTFEHFGNLRGKDCYKHLDNIIVIGANRPGPGEVQRIANALTFDEPDIDMKKLNEAVYRSITTSETNQAVARLRMIWNDEPKNVLILSNEKVNFAVDATLRFDELLAGGSRLGKLIARFGTVPLIDSWLFEHAPDLFRTQTAAKKWIENECQAGSETGLFRFGGRPGRPSRFICAEDEPDPLTKLEENLGEGVTKYKGPERGDFMLGKFYRELTRHPEIQQLINDGIIAGPRRPEP